MKQAPKREKRKKASALSGRLAGLVGACLLGAVFILWDTGVIDLPFLTRRERKTPPETLPGTETRETIVFDYAAFGADVLKKLPDFSEWAEKEALVEQGTFRAEEMTLCKAALPDGDWRVVGGLLFNAESGKLYQIAPKLLQIENPEGLSPIEPVTSTGEALFRHPLDSTLWRYDRSNASFVPYGSDFAPGGFGKGALPLPSAFPVENAGPVLYREGDLYGYVVTVKKGRKTETVALPAVYPTAFPASEGYAVAADASGRAVILNEAGESVFDLPLTLPENDGSSQTFGFYYVENGLLRALLSEEGADGQKTQREITLNVTGGTVELPAGYRAASLREGVFVLTDGSKFGYYNAKSGWLTDPAYFGASPVFEGLAAVQNEDGKKGLVDVHGREILPIAFDYISRFSGGSAVLYSEGSGWVLLTKVRGGQTISLSPDEPPPATSYYTKITITRGPKNTFDHEDDIIIELPPVISTAPYTTRPDNTEPTVPPS